MKNTHEWRPSKFVYRNGKLSASRDPNEVAVGSRVITDIIAAMYHVHLPKHAKGRLLDLGCGNVPLFEAYRNHVTENACVDWSNTLHRNQFIDHECDLNKTLPFREGEFDTIILSDVLEHIAEPEHLWHEMGRVLKSNGKLILSTPFFYPLHEAPYDYYRYTEFALRRFAEVADFEIQILKTLGGIPEILGDILAKNFQLIPWVGRSLAGLVQYVTGLFMRTTIGRKVSERTKRDFPFAYFLIAEKR